MKCLKNEITKRIVAFFNLLRASNPLEVQGEGEANPLVSERIYHSTAAAVEGSAVAAAAQRPLLAVAAVVE